MRTRMPFYTPSAGRSSLCFDGLRSQSVLYHRPRIHAIIDISSRCEVNPLIASHYSMACIVHSALRFMSLYKGHVKWTWP